LPLLARPALGSDESNGCQRIAGPEEDEAAVD